jgi:hypothetical protein
MQGVQMPSHPPRSLQPYSQQQTLEKREKQLRRAIGRMEPTQKLQEAAESVRLAQLLVLKAEQELIRYSEVAHSERVRKIEHSKRASGIKRKRDYWETITVEAILVQYST